MMGIFFQMVLVAIVTAMACALTGLFLVLRGVALMSDAISHAMLLGIVGMFLLIHSLNSPLLLVGAALAGLMTVVATEFLIGTQNVKKDTAIGLVFPAFFSLGIVLITIYARDVHLDSDMVLLGELVFVPFSRLVIGGIDCGPYALWQMLLLLLVNSLVIRLLRKELVLATFDPHYAAVAGFSPSIIHYTLMGLTSVTAVGAFDVVGAIVVVALMITPGSTAYLMTNRLDQMIYYTLLISILSSVAGCALATALDISIAGSIATMAGIIFAVMLITRALNFAFYP